MNRGMTRWGIGPTLFSPIVNFIAGILLIAIGVPVFLIPAFTIDDYFYKKKLCTTGVYAFVRHPIYAAWITWIVPGIVLIRGAVLGLSIPIVMYLIFRILIRQEEQYLEEKFGEEYREYRRKVGDVFPQFRR